MKILFITALLSFAALLGAAFAITRHVRRNAAVNRPQAPESGTSQALEARLKNFSRPVAEARRPRTQPDPKQDFSFFNKETPSASPFNKSTTSPDYRAAPADRS